MKAIEIDNVNIAIDIISETFHCNVNLCAGACCKDGEAGAPLSESEAETLQSNLSQIIPFLSEKHQIHISKHGAITNKNGVFETQLANDSGLCIFATTNEKNQFTCAIETANSHKTTTVLKPISCALYPIRERITDQGEPLLVYDKWDICHTACSFGAEKKVHIYEFVSNALIRKFGRVWYDTLVDFAKSELYKKWKNQ